MSDTETLASISAEVTKQRSKRVKKMKKNKKVVDSDEETLFSMDVFQEMIADLSKTHEDKLNEVLEVLKDTNETVNELQDEIKNLKLNFPSEEERTEKNKKSSKKKKNSSSDEESENEVKSKRKPQPKNTWIMFTTQNKHKIETFLKENEDHDMFEDITDGRKRRHLAAKHLYDALSDEDRQHYKNMGLELFATEHPDLSDKSDKSDNSEEEHMSEDDNSVTEDNPTVNTSRGDSSTTVEDEDNVDDVTSDED
jgi:hypothetical protein